MNTKPVRAGCGRAIHASVVFGPDAYVFEISVSLFARSDQFAQMTPIHANEVD
ncbi:MAG: hypothetical protein WCG81_07255 [Candidatus Angelobacter sp.]